MQSDPTSKFESVIPAELLQEAAKDRYIGRRMSIDPEFAPIALHDGDKVVGFHLPGRTHRDGKVYTGSVFVSKEHRGKGYATQALKSFLEQHPDAISFVNRSNLPSIRAHEKAGYKDTGKRVMGNRRATVWSRKAASFIKNAAITSTEIMQGLSDQMPERPITPAEVEELARYYREMERERTKFHIPTSVVGAGLAGSGIGAFLGGPKSRLTGALAGAAIGGGIGGLSGYRHRKFKMKVQEDLGRELGRAAMEGRYPQAWTKKTASEIADAVISKLTV